jgi:hypothetical protein
MSTPSEESVAVFASAARVVGAVVKDDQDEGEVL